MQRLTIASLELRNRRAPIPNPASDPLRSITHEDLRGKSIYADLEKRFKDYVYRHLSMTFYQCDALSGFAPAGSSQADARLFFGQGLRELRDSQTEKVRAKFLARMRTLEKKIRDAGNRLSKEKSEASDATVNSVISIGGTILGAFFGKKIATKANVSKSSTAMRGATKASQARADVTRAEDAMRQLQLDLDDLNHEIKLSLDEVAEKHDVTNVQLTEIIVTPRKSDLRAKPVTLVWMPWQIDKDGIATPLAV